MQGCARSSDLLSEEGSQASHCGRLKSGGRFRAMTPARTLIGLGTALLALATAAQGALGSAPPLRFASAPARVAQGGHVDVTIAVRKPNVRCGLSVKYANGAQQRGLAATRALGGSATWGWD